MTREEFLSEIEKQLSPRQFSRDENVFELVQQRESAASVVNINGRVVKQPTNIIEIKFRLEALGDGWVTDSSEESEQIPFEYFGYTVTQNGKVAASNNFILYYDEAEDIHKIIR